MVRIDRHGRTRSHQCDTPGVTASDRAADAKLDALRQKQDWAGVFAVLTERAVEGPVADRPKHWNEAATLVRERFRNESEAIRCWTASLAIDPAQPEVVASLRPLFIKRRDFEGLRALANSPSERAAVDDLQRAARPWWRSLFGGR